MKTIQNWTKLNTQHSCQMLYEPKTCHCSLSPKTSTHNINGENFTSIKIRTLIGRRIGTIPKCLREGVRGLRSGTYASNFCSGTTFCVLSYWRRYIYMTSIVCCQIPRLGKKKVRYGKSPGQYHTVECDTKDISNTHVIIMLTKCILPLVWNRATR